MSSNKPLSNTKKLDASNHRQPLSPTNLTDRTHFVLPEGRSADDVRAEMQEKLRLLMQPPKALPTPGSKTTELLSSKPKDLSNTKTVSTSSKSRSSAKEESEVATEKGTTGVTPSPLRPRKRDSRESAQKETVRDTSKERVGAVEQKEGGKGKEGSLKALQTPDSNVSNASTTTKSATVSVGPGRTSKKSRTAIQEGGTETDAKLPKKGPKLTPSEPETRKVSSANAAKEQEDDLHGDQSAQEGLDISREVETTLSVVAGERANSPSESGHIPTPCDAPSPCAEEADRDVCSAKGRKNSSERERRTNCTSEINCEEDESPDTARGDVVGIVPNYESDVSDEADTSFRNLAFRRTSDDASSVCTESDESKESDVDAGSEDGDPETDVDTVSEEEDHQRDVDVVSEVGDRNPNEDGAELEDYQGDVDVADEEEEEVDQRDSHVPSEDEGHKPDVNAAAEKNEGAKVASMDLWSASDIAKNFAERSRAVPKQNDHSKVASMDLWPASDIRRNAAEQGMALPKQTKFNMVAPKILSSASLKGHNGINIMSVISLAPHSTLVNLTVQTNDFHVVCDERVAPVAKFLLEQLITSERVLKLQKIHSTLEASNIRIYTAHSMIQLGHQFAETGEFGFRFQPCWADKLHIPSYRLSLEKAPAILNARQSIINSHPHPILGPRLRGDFHAPTEYVYLRNHLYESCLNGVRVMRLTNYTVTSVKLVFELGDAIFITSLRFNRMPTMRSVNRNPALRNCDNIRFGHKEDCKVKFLELDPEPVTRIVSSLPRKEASPPTMELMCHLFHPEHGTVQLVFDILPQTATFNNNNFQIRLVEVIRTSYSTNDVVVLCNAHPPQSRPTPEKIFPVDYRWKVQVNVGVSADIHREISSYVKGWAWSQEEGIVADKILPKNGWMFKHVPKFPSLTLTRKTVHIMPESQPNAPNGTIIVSRQTAYYPPPPAFVYLYETNRLAHPSTFNLREYKPVTSTSIGGTCVSWTKDQEIKEVAFDHAMWKSEIRRTEELLETLVKG